MSKLASRIILIVFLLIEIVFCVLMFLPGFEQGYIFSFLIVLFAFVYSLKFINTNKICIYTQIALLATVIADIFLVLLHAENKLAAMIFFNSTQIFYFLRLLQQSNTKKFNITFRVCLAIVSSAITALVLKEKTDALSIVSVIYYANLIVNVIYSFIYFKQSPLFAIGLLLFLFCDTFIGLNVAADGYLNITTDSFVYKITHTSVNLPWIFYAPSQVCLAVSLENNQNINIK